MDKILTLAKKDQKIKGDRLDKEAVIMMLWCLILALFWVVFLWGFWHKGPFALGLNAFVFWLFTLLLFVWAMVKKKYYQARDLGWISPFGLIILSYLIYENPFIKIINLPVLLGLGAVFINYGWLKNKEKKSWDMNFILHIISRILAFFVKIGQALNLYIDLLIPRSKRGRGTVRKTVLGLVLFLVIAFTIIIPLLSSADADFAAKIGVIYDWIKKFISETVVYKTIVFIIISLALFSFLLAWGQEHDYQEKEESGKLIDPIVSGIVLGGIFLLYLLFLWVQIGKLWVGSLPFEFKDTVYLVKSGFWQLFFLTVINTLIYFFTYRRTNNVVQRILLAFTVASLLLLFSAGHRMALYAVYYGLSYEKFFASYTVIFAAILFLWLITRLFMARRANVIKFVVFLFLWMYALITVFPVEQFILRSNVALAGRENSRIRLFELTMLSSDVLPLVKRYESEGRLKEPAGYLGRENEAKAEADFDWGPWIRRQEEQAAGKKWYEKNIVNYFN